MTPIEVSSRIVEVVVFSEGAQVTRVAEVTAADGAWPAAVRIAGLPAALDDGSLRVRLDAGAPVVAQGAVVVLDLPSRAVAADPEDRALRDAEVEAERLTVLVARLGNRIRRFLDLEAPPRPAGAEGEPPPASPEMQRLALLDFQGASLDALTAERAALQEQLRQAEARRDERRSQAEQRSRAEAPRPHEIRKAVVVTLAPANRPRRPGAAEPEAVSLHLEYAVAAASWAPAYVLRFAREGAGVDLALRAQVAQRTGEDWRGVSLRLSSARPAAWHDLPELASRRIGRAQAPVRSGWRPPPPGTDALYADYDRFRRTPEPDAAFEDELAELDRDESTSAGFYPELPPQFEESQKFAPAAPPPPPPACAPVPGCAPMAFGAPAMPMSAPMRSRSAQPAPGGAGGGGGRPPPPPAPLAPATEWLDYGRLRLAGPAAPGRGQLARIDDDARCLELLAAISVRAEVNVVAWVRQAAAPAPLEALPPAHRRPAPVDGFDHVYAADQPVDLPSDGQYRALPVLARATTAERRLICVPRETVDVFRQADVRNPLQAPLLPGPVDVYVGEAYLLTAALSAVAPRGTAALGLGVEQAIRVARNARFEEQTTGLLSGTRELRHRIDVEVRSHLAQPVTLEVRERVPVTKKTEEDVKVAVTAEPPWERFEPEGLALRGGHVWRVTVPPDVPVALRAEYVITLPARLELQGGNRREP